MTRSDSLDSALLVLGIGSLALDPASAVIVTNASDTYRTGWYADQASLTPRSSPAPGSCSASPRRSRARSTPSHWSPTTPVRRDRDELDSNRSTPRRGRSCGPVSRPTWNRAISGAATSRPGSGITARPVIDTATTAYFFSKTYASALGPAAWFAHGVDIITGKERLGFRCRSRGPPRTAARSSMRPTSCKRPGLLLLDGVVYAGFGGTLRLLTVQGWIVGVSTLGQIKAMWTARARS